MFTELVDLTHKLAPSDSPYAGEPLKLKGADWSSDYVIFYGAGCYVNIKRPDGSQFTMNESYSRQREESQIYIHEQKAKEKEWVEAYRSGEVLFSKAFIKTLLKFWRLVESGEICVVKQ